MKKCKKTEENKWMKIFPDVKAEILNIRTSGRSKILLQTKKRDENNNEMIRNHIEVTVFCHSFF